VEKFQNEFNTPDNSNRRFPLGKPFSLPPRGYPFRRPCIAALSLTLIALASKP
jgi:hypothetical protein